MLTLATPRWRATPWSTMAPTTSPDPGQISGATRISSTSSPNPGAATLTLASTFPALPTMVATGMPRPVSCSGPMTVLMPLTHSCSSQVQKVSTPSIVVPRAITPEAPVGCSRLLRHKHRRGCVLSRSRRRLNSTVVLRILVTPRSHGSFTLPIPSSFLMIVSARVLLSLPTEPTTSPRQPLRIMSLKRIHSPHRLHPLPRRQLPGTQLLKLVIPKWQVATTLAKTVPSITSRDLVPEFGAAPTRSYSTMNRDSQPTRLWKCTSRSSTMATSTHAAVS
mmetsp:Transcript_25831/g.55585  ORF Transcript_25831/g.55585 Transcript_25831/m.55585 type:complete len:278 (+) Transcript_25831:1962-2795(+)